MFESGTERGAEPIKNRAPGNLALAVSGSAWVAQLVERVLGKDEVTGSIPVSGSSFWVQFSFAGSGEWV